MCGWAVLTIFLGFGAYSTRSTGTPPDFENLSSNVWKRSSRRAWNEPTEEASHPHEWPAYWYRFSATVARTGSDKPATRVQPSSSSYLYEGGAERTGATIPRTLGPFLVNPSHIPDISSYEGNRKKEGAYPAHPNRGNSINPRGMVLLTQVHTYAATHKEKKKRKKAGTDNALRDLVGGVRGRRHLGFPMMRRNTVQGGTSEYAGVHIWHRLRLHSDGRQGS
ncbi:hypothetical protein LZ32DRAFT_606415 [Colletotrichum eremochloae]|nr:hypothetical protein LZ32DRAFT_606415 [Colletotrichum eremochloae]